jgi:A/G-specific adenine glycosylase
LTASSVLTYIPLRGTAEAFGSRRFLTFRGRARGRDPRHLRTLTPVKPPGSLARFRSDLVAWGRVERRSFPWRETSDPFRILVAEVLLQRSRGRTVATVYEDLFRRWPDAETLARARVSTIEAVIRPLGLTKRAATLKALAREVAGLGAVPDTLEGLLALPGVGRYAASATLAVAFGTRAAVVDGVSARVYRRYFGLDGDAPASDDGELWALVEEVTPHEHVREWNWAVLDLAATVCLPKVPRCSECPLRTGCAWSRTSA